LEDVLTHISTENAAVERPEKFQFQTSEINTDIAIAKLIKSQLHDEPLSLTAFLSGF
jgi:hypothetical protein